VARMIAIANPKGGVGKTTTVVNVGVALSQLKKRVLAVDLDPQGALSAGLGLDSYKLEETIYSALLDDQLPIERIIHPAREHLDLIPANIDLAWAEIELIAEIRREFILQRLLEPLRGHYDYILVDCPPSLSLLSVNALCACQELLIPMQCEHFALRSVRPLLDIVEQVRARLNPRLAIAGFLPTLYATGTVHAREVLEEMRSSFGAKVFDVVVYKSIRFAEAAMAGQAIVEYDLRHKGAQAYRDVARILTGL